MTRGHSYPAEQIQLLSWLLADVPAPPGVCLVLLFQVTLAKMRSHVSSCAKVQEQMANCPKFVPVVPTSQPIPRYSCASGVPPCMPSNPGVCCAFPWEEEQHLFPPGAATPGFGAWGGMRDPPEQGGGDGKGLGWFLLSQSSAVLVWEESVQLPLRSELLLALCSNIPNRSTFVCPYCGARNLDQQELVKHCMENHRNDPNKVVSAAGVCGTALEIQMADPWPPAGMFVEAQLCSSWFKSLWEVGICLCFVRGSLE